MELAPHAKSSEATAAPLRRFVAWDGSATTSSDAAGAS